MNELSKREDEIIGRIQELRDDIEAIQQPRSDFALEHFVVGQHAMPGRQRMQCILELQIKLFNIRAMQLDSEKLQIEIDEIRGSNFKIDRLQEIEIEKKELEIAQIELSRLGNVREAEALYRIAQVLPKYTREEYQVEECEYWKERLARQAKQDMIATGRIGQGNQEALRQMDAPLRYLLEEGK